MDRLINEVIRYLVFCGMMFLLTIVGCIPVEGSDFWTTLFVCMIAGFVTFVFYWIFRGILFIFDNLD